MPAPAPNPPRAAPRLETPDAPAEARANRGQILVMFAFFLIGLMGMLGLATDVGFAFAQRRAMQNAADAGALAGAHIVAKAAANPGLAARAEVEALADDNAIGAAGATVEVCSYVDDGDNPVGDCSATVPAAATGVRVTVAEEHTTFFIRVVPGAPTNVTVRATAIAHVRRFVPPSDGPFLVCGIDTRLANGGTMSILAEDPEAVTGWGINPEAIGQTFKIHTPSPLQFADCNEQGALFKGLADSELNQGKTVPPATWFDVKEGDAAGTIDADVQGVQGCEAGQEVVDCVVFLPIAIPKTASDPPKQLLVVLYGAFYVTQPKSNEHHGKLIGAYVVSSQGVPGWTPDDKGQVVIRLTA